MRDLNEITREIVDAAYRIHVRLGPGLLESVYESVMARDLERRGFRVERRKLVSFEFEGLVFVDGLRMDLLVDDLVVVELKSVVRLARVHKKQLLTYLRLADKRVGLLINFGGERIKDGIHRIVNNYHPNTMSNRNLNKDTKPGPDPDPHSESSSTPESSPDEL
jgi:GxxExxY protein